jgi:Protein of unknown function (DUF4238)
MHLRSATGEKVIHVGAAGVRKNIYRRSRAGGSHIHDTEHSLGIIENLAAPILRQIGHHWPLSQREKQILAEFFGRQAVRGPRWMDWHTSNVDVWLQQVAETGIEGVPAQVIRAQLVETRQMLSSDTNRMHRMLSLGVKATAVFAAMHWTLLEFRSDVIATSDHPVVPWPLGVGARRPEPLRPDHGLLQTLETRIPVGSRAAILLTWANRTDTEPARIVGSRDHARNLNEFTIAQADLQWFHLPGHNPPRSTGGRLAPLSPSLVAGYDAAAAHGSQRRRTISSKLEEVMGQDSDQFDFLWIP